MSFVKKYLLLLSVLLSVFFIGTITHAQSVEDKIKEYEQKLVDIRQQKNTLSSQITQMDTQISLTGLQIQRSEQKIVETQKEIDKLSSRIDNLDSSLNSLSKLLLRQVAKSYKTRSVSLVELLFETKDMNDLANKIKYLRATQNNNQKLLVQVQEAKLSYEEQKVIREQKKQELDQLISSLNRQKEDLKIQQAQKQKLLADTNNDEKTYQTLLTQAQAEYNAVSRAKIYGAKVGTVKKGDIIALVGNSGYPYCSTGAHLHFEIQASNTWVDPGNYLSSHTVIDDQNGGTSLIGSGSWDWPLQDSIILTQHFGHTPYSWRYSYSGGVHTGLDLVSKGSDEIRAPADGTLYSTSEACGSATINVKYIEHGNGIVSYYLHVQ
jgi:peptidoglycan hydrolase CwlO-like protein